MAQTVNEVEPFNAEPVAHHWFAKDLKAGEDHRAERTGTARVHARIFSLVIPEAAKRLSGTITNERLLLGGPGSAPPAFTG